MSKPSSSASNWKAAEAKKAEAKTAGVKEKKARPSNLYFYLHTHWDREWYWSFGAYRTQLVTVVKNILHLLESGALDKFMLDGQTALIEDVLEISPALGPRIKSLVKAGKLFIGPWYVLADQMLVGGESLVRNLHYGLALSKTYGGATRVGYCPDTFGHSADLPRILQGFSIEDAVVWRGAPRLALGPLFDWRSPDGSEVLTLDLTQGYYQTAFGENLKPEALAKNLLSFLGLEQYKGSLIELDQLARSVVSELEGALMPVGGDHVGPQADFKEQLSKALAVINSGDEKGADKNNAAVKAEVVSLNQFFSMVRAASDEGLNARPLVETELRSNDFAFEYARAYMLAGVLSSRLYLKRENRLSEHKILRQVEPFRALLAVHGILPYCHDELDFNWKLLLKNHPHDSICGCSIDTVHREMQSRTVSLNDGLDVLLAQGKEALLERAVDEGEVRFGARNLDLIDPALALSQVAIFNPASSPFIGPVRVKLALESGKAVNLPEGFQKLGTQAVTEAFLGLSRVPVFKDITIVDGYIDAGSIPGGTLKTISMTSPPPATGASFSEAADCFGGLQLSNEFFNLKFDKDGNLIATLLDDKGDGDIAGTAGGASAAAAKGKTITLGHQFVDVGDAGDSYNFDPIAGDRPIMAKLVSIGPGRKGPLVASLVAHYQIDLPEGLVAKGELGKRGEAEDAPKVTLFERAKVRIPHKIESEIILKKGVPIVFFQTTMNNTATDHRLEVVFDRPKPVEHTLSENHFALIKRYHDVKAELNPIIDGDDLIGLGRESKLTRYPCQRFFVAGDSTYMNIGLPEYGVGDSAVSITLLRAFSYLSRKRLRTRGGGAGPIMPTPEGNCLGLMRASYGYAPIQFASALPDGKVSDEAAPYVLTDLFEGLPLAFAVPDGAVADKSLSLFSVDDPDIRVAATFIDEQERLVIRLLNATSKPKSVKFSPHLDSQVTTLANFDGSGEKQLIGSAGEGKWSQFSLDFNPCQLLTIFCRF
jgi:hypothetical protein